MSSRLVSDVLLRMDWTSLHEQETLLHHKLAAAQEELETAERENESLTHEQAYLNELIGRLEKGD
ncbi:unnamed protein product, partial [Amoebophrya sp. A25]|eukprot:GSA25T00007462001.1